MDARNAVVVPEAKLFREGLPLHTHEQRVALARRRFFEDGEGLAGVVPSAVLQSWDRCVRAGVHPHSRPEPEYASASELRLMMERNRTLLEFAQPELDQLDLILAGTPCKAMLVDPDGTILHASPPQHRHGELLNKGTRAGSTLREQLAGTTAPMLSAVTGCSTTVLYGEHFYDMLLHLHCAAAPLRDQHGQVLAVLDVSVDGQPFSFDASTVVRLAATAIENRLLVAQGDPCLVVRFHIQPSLLNTAYEGMLGVNERGVIAWINDAGAQLLRLKQSAGSGLMVEEVLGMTLHGLLGRVGHGSPGITLAPGGMRLWLDVQCAPIGHNKPPLPMVAASADPPDRGASKPLVLGEPLTGKEVRVLRLLADGHSDMAIADKLCVSIHTVRSHLRNLYFKLDAHSRMQAVLAARRAGII
ncbi:MAG: LuxR C-terminal-related transcriptional regulator [Burkholderiales bacterium]